MTDKEYERWFFGKDDDGHNYLVPLSLKKEFNELLNKMSPLNWSDELYDLCDIFDDKFSKYRCEHPSMYSFLHPKREK